MRQQEEQFEEREPRVRYKKKVSYSCKLEDLRRTGKIKQMPCACGGACGEQILFCTYGAKLVEKIPYVRRGFFDREDDE